MRTTIDLADDVLMAARAIARDRGKTIGEVMSDLARTGLRKPAATGSRNGVPLLAQRATGIPVTLDLVNDLRDEQP